ncbi:unnamed protein product [Lymnaea stagnalis]|uniref:Solute carrier organic anion transporter family member n=1 Tax=Lymnaea stagnalis TaxID=6523 RepID=A0AAV2INM9_LYMST
MVFIYDLIYLLALYGIKQNIKMCGFMSGGGTILKKQPTTQWRTFNDCYKNSAAMSYTVVPHQEKTQVKNGAAIIKRENPVDTRCGCGLCHPACMQPCANICCFTGLYSLAALLTSTLNSYVNSQVTTLERQFGFTSQQTGLIMAANDIGFLLCVLFVSYSASRLHIPRSLGIATITFGISGIVCSVPHFIFKDQLNMDPTELTNETSSLFGDLCDVSNTTALSCEHSNFAVSESIASGSLCIIVIGMMLQGFGKAPRASFVVTYVDDNTKRANTGIFVGIIIASGIFGPAVAYLMGGMFSRMYVTLKDTTLSRKHPLWIGAWWLGYVVFGIISLAISVPLFCFPRKLPQKNEREKPSPIYRSKAAEGVTVAAKLGTKGEKTDQIKGTTSKRMKGAYWIAHFKNFTSTLVRLWTNPVYVCIITSSCFLLFAVSATNSYTPKYLEAMFHLPTYKSNYIMAGKQLFSSVLGTLVGGFLTKRLKMTAMRALLFILISVTVSVVCSAMGFVFQCDQPTTHNMPGTLQACNSACSCPDNSYFAICGEDGKTYYSPCSAGCSHVEDEIYHNCTCIPGGTAYTGACDPGCTQLYPYALFSALRSLTGTLSIVPKIIVLIRCVEERDKGFAIGFQAFMTSLFGWLLGPVIIGYVIDGFCTVWSYQCDTRGRCLLYDNELFRVKLHSYGTVAMACSLVFLVIAYAYARCTKCLEGKGDDHAGRNDALTLIVHGNDVKDADHVDRNNGLTLILQGDDVKDGKELGHGEGHNGV